MKRTTVLLVLAAPLCGCGLGEYEERMAEGQERVKALDSLDGPIKWPPPPAAGTTPPQLPDVFLRPPKGIRTAVDGAVGPLHRFSARQADTTFQAVYVAAAAKDNKDLLANALAALGAGQGQVSKTRVPAGGGRELTFDTRRFEVGGSAYSANLFEGRNANVVVVYQWDKGKAEAAEQVAYSLGTVATDDEARRARARVRPPSKP